jgi:hypothetical protein
MDQAAIIQYITDTFAGVDAETPTEGIAAGDTFFIYDPERNLEPKRRMPFATIVTKDYGEFDAASNLNRAGVFRLNIGVGKDTFARLLGQASGAAAPNSAYDYAALDQLLPHPVYAPQSWVCVLNPSDATFRSLEPLLAEAYDIVVRRRRRPAADT